jgi:hypothetical protein
MNAQQALLDLILPLKIVDTHEHLPLERDLSRQNTDVLASWLNQYFSCDLVSAGLTPKELEEVRKPGGDLLARWKKVEKFWHAAESTGYGRALALAARDLFDTPRIDAGSIVELNARLLNARNRKDYYRWLLGGKCGLAVSIRDSFDPAMPDTLQAPDPFVFTLRTDPFIMPTHRTQMREIGHRVGVTVTALEDWEETVRRTIETYLAEPSRVVCLKCGLAYNRELRFEKATRAEAEQGFNQFFGDEHSPSWRPPLSTPKALQDYMQHVVCRIADEHGLVYQVHTGLQEGNGNILAHSNPTLLTNLFLNYENVKFDLFHIGYPYVMEAGALAKNFRNVFLDMCWAHIISPEASRRALVEWLDAVPANKIMGFGGDYGFPEGVYGHQYLARRNIAAEIARWLLVDNPVNLFGLQAHV